jgi:hypothetical protein
MNGFLNCGIIAITSKSSYQHSTNLSQRLCIINEDGHAIHKQIFCHTFKVDLIWEECRAFGEMLRVI